MIKFHKIDKPPKKVPEGEEHIWFANYGAIYVADNKGLPRLITSGNQRGESIPTGKPEEPGIIYYCDSNGKTYISSPEKWLELPLKGIPGTGGGAGTASTVLLEDPGSWFTSINVEGAMTEIAEAMPHYFGKKHLANFSGNADTLKTPGEVYITPTAKPSSLGPGWRSTRQNDQGRHFAFHVGDNGSVYAGPNGSMEKLANDKDLEALKKWAVSNVSGLGSKKISVGPGLETNGKGIGEGLKISIKNGTFASASHNHDTRYVKKTGDTMSGTLTVLDTTAIDSKVAVQSKQNKFRTIFYYNSETNNTGIYDSTHGAGVLRYNAVNGRTALYAYQRNGEERSGKFEVYADNEINFYPSEKSRNNGGAMGIKGGPSTRILRVDNLHGGLTFGSNQSINFIDSTRAGDPNTPRNLDITGGNYTPIPKLRLNARTAYSDSNDFVTRQALTVGKDEDANKGTGAFNSKIYLFPYEVSSEKGKDNYTHFGYSQKTQTLYFRSYSRYQQKVSSPGDNTIRVGSQVVVTRPVDWYGTHLAVGGEYTVSEVRGNRIVIGRGGVVTAAIHVSNLRLANPPKSTTTTTTHNPLTVKATKFVNTSSIKYKDVKGEMEHGALEGVMNSSVYRYKFKNDTSNKESVGLIIEKGAPREVVDAEGDSIDGYAMTSYLWKAVQELTEEVNRLKDKLGE